MSVLAALLLAFQAVVVPEEPPPSYPVFQAEPDFGAAGGPFKVVDLRYELSDTFASDHAFLARVRVRGWGFLDARFQGEERALTLEMQRLLVSASGREGAYALAASYRAPRFLLTGEAERITAPGPRGWRLSPSLSIRVSPDLELLGGLTGDTRQRFLRAASLGFLWQRGARWEAFGEYLHTRESTAPSFENTSDTGVLALVAQVGRAELSVGGRLEDTRGRFPHREGEPDVGLRMSLAPRLLLEGGARLRLERDAGERSHHYDAGLTWFGRRFTLPRAGRAAERAVGLARRATGMGYNERRTFDEEGLRRQRERLSLGPDRNVLLEDMAAVYREEVRERAVPLLGIEIVDEEDRLAGTDTQFLRVLFGAPWPFTWPWQTREGGTSFLRLDLERERLVSGPGFPALTHTGRLTASLNREIDLQVSWSRRAPTPLDLIRGVGQRRTVGVSFVYAFGR